MPQAIPTPERLAALLPDIPRYLEARSLLLLGSCEVLGLEQGQRGSPEPSFVAREMEEDEEQMIYVVGHPSSEIIREAARRNLNRGMILSTPEDAPHVQGALPGWTTTRATLHLLGDASRLPKILEEEVKWFAASDLDAESDRMPEHLVSFLEEVLDRGAPVAAAFAGERPVSFCCASDETETLWDISIDTLEEYRRQGHAGRCVSWLVAEMRKRGKEPVWGAEESNPPSMRLAAKLGFVPVDELILFRPA
ncbi:MAG: GNAT family N-acetyltransferase [Rubrobacteraceae bacterium]